MVDPDEVEILRAENADLKKALIAACIYIECARPNLGKKASANYWNAACSYREIAAGRMKFKDLED